MCRLQKAVQGTTPLAFLKSPQSFGRPAGRAPCVSFQALFTRPVWGPCLERVWNASPHRRGAHTVPAYTAPMGARRLQETWSYFRARSASQWQQKQDLQGRNWQHCTLLAATSPFCSSQDEGIQKAPDTGDPGARLFFASHLEDTNMYDSPVRKQRLPDWKFDFLSNTPLTQSFLSETLRKILLKQHNKSQRVKYHVFTLSGNT